jgi:hypothetical protein
MNAADAGAEIARHAMDAKATGMKFFQLFM